MDTNKEHIYLQNMQRSMVEVYAQIEHLLESIPDDIDEKDLTPEPVSYTHLTLPTILRV